MGKPLFGSALVSVFSGWYELLGYCLVPVGEARGHLPKFVLDTTMVSFKRCLQR